MILPCVWSGQLGAGQIGLIDSYLAYRVGWASSRRSCPVWPLSTGHFHNISGVSALKTDSCIQRMRASTHTYTPTYTHTLYPLGAKLQWWSGPCMPSRVWCDGEGRKQGGVRDVKIVFNQSQSLVQLMEKVTALLIPSPGTITVILSHSVFYIYITQHTRCKEYNLLALHLAVQILGFRRLLQTPQRAYCKWTVGGHFSKYC